jgi:hypothetical protein
MTSTNDPLRIFMLIPVRWGDLWAKYACTTTERYSISLVMYLFHERQVHIKKQL